MVESIITNYYHSDLWTRFRFRETSESTANQFEFEKSELEEEKCPVPSSSGLADSAKQNATYKALLKEIACEDASIRSISSKVLEKWCKKEDRSFTSSSNINSDNSWRTRSHIQKVLLEAIHRFDLPRNIPEFNCH